VITRDGNIVMTVKPSISTGEINPTTELPEEDTTEVETSLMLPSGHGMVIGGLIQEEDLENQEKVPILGDLWLVGRLFQRREITRRREEIIITLVPHIMPYGPLRHQDECHGFQRATTPLLYGSLNQNPRPFEPRFPDAGQCDRIGEKFFRLHPPPDPGGWGPGGPMDPCLPEGLAFPPPAHGLPEPPQPAAPTPPGGPSLQPPVPDLSAPEEVVPQPGPPPAERPALPPPAVESAAGAAMSGPIPLRQSQFTPPRGPLTAGDGLHPAARRPAQAVTLASGEQPVLAADASRSPESANPDAPTCRRLPYCREYVE
jgi:hypothetical protein